MSKLIRSLYNLKNDEVGIIKGFSSDLFNKVRIMEMGILKDVTVRMVRKTPLKGPIELKVRSYYITLRCDDALKIYIK